MTSAAPAASLAASPEPGAVGAFVRQSLAIADTEIRKLRRDPTELFTRAVQPALWLIIFGETFTHIRAIPTGDLSYLEFMAPGVLAQSVLFSAIFFGIAVIWERDLGIIHKLLVSPAYRGALVMGKAISAGLRGLTQAFIIYLLALVLGIRLQLGVPALLGVVAVVMLGSALFATFSLIVACLVKTRERFMGIGQVLTMPLFFASNAIYPLAIMPRWLQAVARVNPLTYVVDALRGLMIQGGHSALGFGGDLAFPAAAFVVLLAIAARLYPGLVR
ncbi:MAG TPA: ABC transporter permease [Gemmatimonadales bacterium]|nr:ABC transporter permease [Gemmatimonadales bacterium]